MNHGLILGSFLLSILLLVHFSSQRRPLSSEAPLDVDDNLPAPWAGYASSAFSLSGIFGAFLGMFLILGWSAMLGIAIGVILSLVMVRSAITRANPETFEEFLRKRRFCTVQSCHLLLWLFLGLAQLWFAASELVLLREISIRGLGLGPRHATALALSIALIVYFYCLLGGYDAVFRSDVVQFAGMATMCIWIAYLSLTSPDISIPVDQHMAPPREFWSFGIIMSRPWKLALNMAISIPIGATGLLGTPGTWKRVFLALRRGSKYNSFAILVVAGVLPFALLSPVLWRLRNSITQELPLDFLFTLGDSRAFSLALLIGMISAFMSAFNSSIVVASHIFMTKPTPQGNSPLSGLDMYRISLCIGFALIIVTSLTVFNQGANPYIIGNFMVGPFCILGGLILGTSFLERPFSGQGLFGIVLAFLVGWFAYMANLVLKTNTGSSASISQVESMPVGTLLFVLTAGIAWLSREKVRKT